MKIKTACLFALFLHMASYQSSAQNQFNQADFQSPPQSVKVHTWWHWISGNITREGITKDLESMKSEGISQATILNIGGFVTQNLMSPRVSFNSDEWYKMFEYALSEAKRLDIKIGVHNCDGWSTSGGPWITPELSMKQFTYSKTIIEGGKKTSIQLAQPPALKNFYRDVAVVAVPYIRTPNFFQTASPKIRLNNTLIESVFNDGNPLSEQIIKKGDTVIFEFKSDFSTDKLVIFPHLDFDWTNMAEITSHFTLSISDSGENYNKVADLKFVGINKFIEATFPTVKAKFFKLECTDCFQDYPVAEIELLSDNEKPRYSPDLSFLLEKTVNVKALSENNFKFSSAGNIQGIPEKSVIDLTSMVSPEGLLKWNAPVGKWLIIRFGYTTNGITNQPSTPEGVGLEIDKMDTTALNLHFNSFARKLINSAGQLTGNTFRFILIDSWECHFQNWTKNFPEEFKQRRGYDLISWIPVLCGETVENTKLSDAFLFDFRKTISDLIDQNYYGHIKDLCHQNNLELHAEVIYGNDGMYPPLDVLRSNKHIDLPMTEFWANPNSNQIPEYYPSKRPNPGFPMYASLAYNKPVIGSEAYTGYAHYSESPFDLKPFGDAAYCSGINQMILHSYVHQPFDKKPGVTLGQFAAHFNRNNPWWDYAQDWMTYQSRIQYILQKGEPIVDVVFYAGDQLPQYFSKSILNELPFGYQANACNFEMLKNEANVIDGEISFGSNQKFQILALPKQASMEYETLKQIARLVNEGAVVYGPKPTEMLSLTEIKNNSDEFFRLVEELWGTTSENRYGKGMVISGKTIGEVLKQYNIVPDFTTNSGNPDEFMYIHKKVGNSDIYFVFNQQNKTLSRELVFRVNDKAPEIWNPENGVVAVPAIYSFEKTQTRIPVTFYPREAKIFIFEKNKEVPFIQQAFLAGTQIFPQPLTTQTSVNLPQATYSSGNFLFTSEIGGDYSFVTSDKQTLKLHAAQARTYVINDFKGFIEFFPISDETIGQIEISEFNSLTDFDNPAIKYFAGKAKYKITFNVPEDFTSPGDSVVLMPGKLDAAAEVRFNGKVLAYSWTPDAHIPVKGLLKKENILEITVANVCRNRLIGDFIQFGKIKSIWTTSPIETILDKSMPLKPSGLMGPVKLISYKIQTAN